MSELPKIRRPSIRPLDEWVDDFMLGLGLASLDMADPVVREKVRKYVHGRMRQCLQLSLFDLKRGAERGVEQAMDFMLDPDHAQNRKKRLRERREKRQQQEVQEHQQRQIKEREKLGRVQ